MRGELRIVDDVAAAFCDVVADAWRSRTGDLFTIALSGGGTARRCYEALARHAGTPVDWSEVRVVWGDERCVPLDHEDSNHRLAQEALLRPVGPVGEIHPMQCEVADEYDALIARLDIDLVHLGLGPDAHTASLFPASPARSWSRSKARTSGPPSTGSGPARTSLPPASTAPAWSGSPTQRPPPRSIAT